MLRGFRVARFFASLRKGERGQALIFFVGGITIIMGMAALAVDVGLWYTDRAIARKDADAAADEGARWYDQGQGTLSDAEAHARMAAQANGVLDPDANVQVDSAGCLGDSDAAIQVTVDRPSSAFFSKLFVDFAAAPVTRGVATACVASVEAMDELRPLAMVLNFDTTANFGGLGCVDGGGSIRFGELCALRLRTYGQASSAGWQRAVDLDTSGPACSDDDGGLGDLDNNIQDGSSEVCWVSGVLYRERQQTTPSAGQILALLEQIQIGLDGSDPDGLLDDNDCDQPSDGNQIDNFGEVFADPGGAPAAPSDGVFTLACVDADRLVYLPVVAALPPGGGAAVEIEGFVPFFITECVLYKPQPGPGFQTDSDPLCDEVPEDEDDEPAEGFEIRGYPLKLQEPLENGVEIKVWDNFGTRRPFLYDE